MPQWWSDKWSRSWWWTMLLTPVVTLWSGALEDLHSDYLHWILQTQNNPGRQLYLRTLYWPQYLLAWSWDLELTARLNTLVRVGGLVFCVLWCSRLVSMATGVRWGRVSMGLAVFCVAWAWWWPELGDSLVYSGTSLGVFVFLAALGDPLGLSQRLSRRWFPVVLVLASFVAAATYVQSLLVVLPLFVWVVWFVGSIGNGRRLGLLALAVVGGAAAVLRLRVSGDEETGLTTFGLLTRIRTTRHLWDGTLYLWDSLRAAALLALLTVLMSWWLRSAKLAALGAAGFAVSVSVVPVAALRHVQTNLMMPRYFAAQITIGLLVQFLVVIALVWMFLERCTAVQSPSLATRLVVVARLVVVVTALVSVVWVSIMPLGFGLDYGDQSGNSKMARPLEEPTINRIEELQRLEATTVLVHLNHWDLYPSVFLLQQEKFPAMALDIQSTFDFAQRRFSTILATRSYLVVCAVRFSTCVPDVGSVLVQRGVTRFNISVLETTQEYSGRVLEILKVSRVETPVVP